MTQTLFSIRTYLGALLRSERAQDGFEYMLVIGAVSVAIIGLMVTPLGDTVVQGIIDGLCLAIDDLMDLTTPLDCSA